MPRILALTTIGSMLCAGAAASQTTTSTIVKVPGKTVEVLGLRRWTVPMIQDSMNRYAPGTSITSHACAAVLRYRLRFATAAALYTRVTDTSEYVIVPVIEPQDSALVRMRPMPRDTTDSRAPWPLLVELAGTRRQLLHTATILRIWARGQGRAPVVPDYAAADSAELRRVWAYLDEHSAPRDMAEAQRLLATAPNIRDRTAAVAVLSSFDREDAAWWPLVSTLLERDGPARGLAWRVLDTFGRAAARPVDWAPAAADLHAVLNGSNLWALRDVLDVLVATGVEPRQASALLRGGGHAVLMFAGAAHPWPREPAHHFLRAVSGRDFGGDVAAWRDWIAAL